MNNCVEFLAMRALVIDAFGEKGREINFQIGVGPRLIATVISESGVECDLAWFRMVQKKPRILKDYDVILVSGFTTSKELIDSLCKIVEDVNPKAVKILGGPIAFDPYDYFLKSDFDIAVVGEGEKTVEELLNSDFDLERLRDIRGIAFKEGNNIIFTSPRQPLEKKELDRIPDAEYVKAYPFYRFVRVSVECVRGCSNFNRPRLELADGTICIECGNCESEDSNKRIYCPEDIPPGCGYCCVPGIFGPSRSRDRAAIVEEIQNLIDVGVTKIALSAPDLLDYKREEMVPNGQLTDPFHPEPNYDEFESLLSSIAALDGVNERVFISIDELKPTLLNNRILEIIAKYLPGSTIVLVCESGSKDQLKELGRPFPVEKNIEMTRKAGELGLVPMSFFINWLPNQTPERTDETLQIMAELEEAGCQRMLCYRLAALPATAFYGMTIDENDRLNTAIFRKA
ncbi:MAG: B12-binding domain-containing radical SAM protein, partial [Candidatus Hydrothermarchaeales archaeon]